MRRRARYWLHKFIGWLIGMIIIGVIAAVIYLKYS
jgi:hypothetical protein